MVITDIKRQSKRTQRFSIYIDDTYSFSLDELELSSSSLRLGDELSQDEIDDWRSRSASAKAYDAGLRYLSYRKRSIYEMKQYLLGKDYDEETIRQTIERFEDLELLNDRSFAESWVSDRNRMRPRSQVVLRAELSSKGIDREIIKEVLETTSRDEQVMILRSIIEQKAARYRDPNKLMAYLASKGYDYGLIKAALAVDED